MIAAEDVRTRFPAIERHADRLAKPLDEMCRMFFSITRDFVTEDIHAYLVLIAQNADRDRCVYMFRRA